MSLVVTDISSAGIVMAADTAETVEVFGPSRRRYVRTKFGNPKLFPLRRLNGGVSYWGAGEIPVEHPGGSGRLLTDVWLEDFIETDGRLDSLEQFAYTLRRTVNVLLGPEASALGFQIAGLDGRKFPAFYRVANHDRSGAKRMEFEVEQITEFPRVDEEPVVIADGDETVFVALQERRSAGAGEERRCVENQPRRRYSHGVAPRASSVSGRMGPPYFGPLPKRGASAHDRWCGYHGHRQCGRPIRLCGYVNPVRHASRLSLV